MPAEPEISHRTRGGSDQLRRLLIVEDNSADSRLLERLLNQVMPQHPRETVTTLKAATEAVSTSDPLMIISDLNLPDSDGLSTVHQLLAQAPTVPVVVLTAQGFDSVGLAAVEAGAEDFLTKGTFDAFDLARVLLMAIERHRAHMDTIRQAHHDPLTGLGNRAYFERTLDASLARARRLQDQSAVAFIDVDKFKSVNDGYGHRVGDEVLCKVADRIQASIRPYDFAARFGGDEFAVLLSSVGESRALSAIGSRILNALNLPYRVSGSQIAIELTVSIGVATSGVGSATANAEDIMQRADGAMYVAKKMRAGVSLSDG